MKQYDYYLPKSFIADRPAVPRDTSKLLVYNTKENTIITDIFLHVDQYLPKRSLIVFNKTKVVPARIEMRKKTGGNIQALCLINEIAPYSKGNTVRIFVDRRVEVGDRLMFDTNHSATVIKQEEHIFTVKFDFSIEKLFALLEQRGTMPIPLYIKHTPLSQKELQYKYQSFFAQDRGSAAAPTASLHFTNRVFRKLKQKGIQKSFVTLHVGMGTFAPVTKGQIQSKKLHAEWYEVPYNTRKFLFEAKQEGRPIIAVGTTVVRTLESMNNKQMSANKKSTIGTTDLFIFPPYSFTSVDCLITNFHLPRSSLMMLVDAFLEYKKAKRRILDLYKYAIKHNFRFYSFGDAMLVV